MATYEFRCVECKKVFDRIIPMEKRNEKMECPECGGDSRRRVTSPGHTWSPTRNT